MGRRFSGTMQWPNQTKKLLALLACLLMAPLSSAFGWVLVYDLKFEAVGDSVNFRPYDGGYYLAPRGTDSNGGTLILFRHTGAQKQYFLFQDFGEIFYAATNGQSRKAVLSAAASNFVSSTTFYAIGDAKNKVKYKSLDGEGFLYVAPELKGFAISADSERDLPFAGEADDPHDVGVAGTAELTCTLNESYTEDPEELVSTLSTMTSKMLQILAQAGYVNGAQGQGSGSTAGTTTAGTFTGETTTAGNVTGANTSNTSITTGIGD